MNRIKWLSVGLLASLAVGALAVVPGGFPSFMRLQQLTISGINLTPLTSSSTVTGARTETFANASTVTGDTERLSLSAGSSNLQMGACNQNQSTLCKLTSGPTSASAFIETFGAIPLAFGTGNAKSFQIDGATQITDFVNPPTIGGVATSGSFTCTGTGFASATTGTCTYTLFGKLAILIVPVGISGTSNAATFTITGLPAAIQPVTTQTTSVASNIFNNSAYAQNVSAQVTASGTLTMLIAGASGGWTASGTKGFQATNNVITYALN